jgi:hypothetical protein
MTLHLRLQCLLAAFKRAVGLLTVG